MPHVVLLLLIAGENADLAKVGVEKVLEYGGPEGASTAGDHEGSIRKRAHV